MTCTGCDGIYNLGDVLPDAAGTVYYRPYALYGQSCHTTEKPCIETSNVCFPGLNTCVCDPVTNYSPTSDTCVTGCTTFGTTYQKYPLYSVLLYDYEAHAFQYNVTSCLEYCHSDVNTLCYGVDYDFISSMCYFNSESALTKPEAWLPSTVLHMYMRNCV